MRILQIAVSAVLVSALLTSCKIEVLSDLKVSELEDPSVGFVEGSILVEVAGCRDFEDSRRPSDSLQKVQESIPKVFKGAGYVECFSKQFESFAQFDLPFAVFRGTGDETVSKDNIIIFSNDESLLMLMVPEPILARLEDLKQSSYGMSDFDDVSATFNLHNDTDTALELTTIASYVDGKAGIFDRQSVAAGESISIRLSDVSVSLAMSANGAPVVMRH